MGGIEELLPWFRRSVCNPESDGTPTAYPSNIQRMYNLECSVSLRKHEARNCRGRAHLDFDLEAGFRPGSLSLSLSLSHGCDQNSHVLARSHS